jgi:hypothetical protein
MLHPWFFARYFIFGLRLVYIKLGLRRVSDRSALRTCFLQAYLRLFTMHASRKRAASPTERTVSAPAPRRRRYSGGDSSHQTYVPDWSVSLRVTKHQEFGNGTIKTITWQPGHTCPALEPFLEALGLVVVEQLRKALVRHGSVKIYVDVHLTYVSVKDVSDKKRTVLRTKARRILRGSNIGEELAELQEQIRNRNTTFIRLKSGLVLDSVDMATLNVGHYNALAGSSYVELPEYLKRKQAVINVKNTDNRCFGYAILSSRYSHQAYTKNRSDPKQYDKYFQRENLHRVKYPVAISDLENFEREFGQAINVISFYDDKGTGMYSVYHSKINSDTAINLLYWKDHYAWIKDFPRLLSGISKHKARSTSA